MIFTMFLASVRGERPDIENKRRIGNAATVVVECEGGTFHIVKESFWTLLGRGGVTSIGDTLDHNCYV